MATLIHLHEIKNKDIASRFISNHGGRGKKPQTRSDFDKSLALSLDGPEGAGADDYYPNWVA